MRIGFHRSILLAAALAAPGCGEARTSMEKEKTEPVPTGREIVTLGGGCFWCIEAVFEELRGVDAAVSGYAGGEVPNPSYKAVCSGTTGHAEVVEITFDPKVVPLRRILDVFFTVHDPTTLNRQGPDVGTQYRSVAFYRDATQKREIEETIRSLAERKAFPGKIVTEVVPFEVFYPAEDYHQEYFELNGEAPYCRAVIAPKIGKFRKEFKEFLKR